jgi:hypothetical protein
MWLMSDERMAARLDIAFFIVCFAWPALMWLMSDERMAARLDIAFFIVCFAGLAGLLLDVDHLLACLFVGQWPGPGDWSCGNGRPAHISGIIVVFIAWCVACSCMVGLCVKAWLVRCINRTK